MYLRCYEISIAPFAINPLISSYINEENTSSVKNPNSPISFQMDFMLYFCYQIKAVIRIQIIPSITGIVKKTIQDPFFRHIVLDGQNVPFINNILAIR